MHKGPSRSRAVDGWRAHPRLQCAEPCTWQGVKWNRFKALATGSVSCRNMWRALCAGFQSWLLVGVIWHMRWLIDVIIRVDALA